MIDANNLPAVEIAVRTDPGRDPDKQVNEDASTHVETKLGLLCVVCDGMGGHAGGKEASNLAVKTIVECVRNAPDGAAGRDVLRSAVEEANAQVFGMPTMEAGYRPGSTVVAVLAHALGAEIAHVGDSRVYLVHAGAIAQVTRDHSMVQEMVDRNLIRAEDAATHPDANKILRALGIAKEVEVDVRPEPVAYVAGDVFVLCSDGLSDLVQPAEILQIAGSHPPAQAAGQLVDLANARGGHDNITAMVVRMKASATASEAPTIVKTVPLTAHDPTPATVVPDAGSGPKTLLAAPVQGAMGGAAPLPAALPPTHQSGNLGTVPLSAPMGPGLGMDPSSPGQPVPAIPPPPSTRVEGRSRAPLIAGVVLAIVAIGIVAGLIWAMNRPQHKETRLVDDDRETGAAATSTTPPDVEAGTDPPLVVPTLPLDGGRPHHHHRRDGGRDAQTDAAQTPANDAGR